MSEPFSGTEVEADWAPTVEPSARAKRRTEIMIPCSCQNCRLRQMVPTSMTAAPPARLVKA
ncbi:hypothetical protein MA16_Dca000880 [Dendrobium catenatum]|uniref:Uncharacterized protein n=1 Tax=Dendrobium catenatum TaxID=906689 RepID=A0A2I0WV45_9ASPA|nr:hypothetical protein MA16_Dca000880 [Dendrobium catenatum]